MEFIDILLWMSLFLLIAGAFLPRKYGCKIAAVGWVVFGARWLLALPELYSVEHNIMYSVACILAVPVTLYMALLLIRDERESLVVVTRAAAIGSIFYFPFANIPALSDGIIGVTANLTLAMVNALGQHAVLSGLNDILLNGADIQIILACTAIQSMALFVGVVGCIKAPTARLAKAFLVSVPVIYVLNLVRNTFVTIASGDQWFQIFPGIVTGWTGRPAGYTSFFWAHNVFAEIGSLIALFVIAYAVFGLLPELLLYIQDLASLVEIKNIKRNLRGEKVPELKPLQRKA